MANYSIITGLANDRQPYKVLPDFYLDLGNGATFRFQWPANAADDVDYVDVFGSLAKRGNPDAPIDLRVFKNEVGPVPPEVDLPPWELEFPANGSDRAGAKYPIHKGLRIPYRYTVPVIQSTPTDGRPHANVFILWTGHGGYP